MKRLNAVSCIATALLLFALGERAYATSNVYSESINLSVNRWLAAQKPSGFIPYGESEPRTKSATNLIRQTGTVAVLADYYALTKDQRMRAAIQRLLSAFGRHSLPIGGPKPEAEDATVDYPAMRGWSSAKGDDGLETTHWPDVHPRPDIGYSVS